MMQPPDPATPAATGADLTARLAAAERAVAARDKTILALVKREKDRAAKRHSIFATMEENAVLQQVVARKTLKLETQNRKLEAATAALRQSEERMRLQTAALESAANGVAITDANGKIQWVNRAFTQLTGYTLEEVIGQNPRALKSGQHPASFYKQMWETISQGRVWNGEIINRHKTGQLYHEEMTITPIRDASGATTNYVAIKQDITKRKRAETELEALHKQLLETSRRAGMAEVATNVLHNVGNVLNSVNISATLVVESAKKSKTANLAKVVALLREHESELGTFLSCDPQGKQVPAFLAQLSEYLLAEQAKNLQELDSLLKHVQHIKEIVARQQSHARVSGVKEIINLRELVEDALRMNLGALDQHCVEVVREFEAVPLINIDRHKILQILVNLLRNATHACQDSGRADKRLTVRVAQSDDRIKISVTDNGIGIPPENLTRIFGHGFTTRQAGHGFGLHGAALAAKEMGGALTAHSAGPGQGATFTLELPVSAEAIPPRQPVPTTTGAGPAALLPVGADQLT
jgi:PAS domain S-box-containing protein